MYVRHALSILLLTCLSGCGGAPDGPELHPVTGKVTYKGEPVPNATITFLPTEGPLGSAVSESDGTYSISTAGRPGAVAGSYSVAVTAVKGGTSTANITPDSPEYAKMMSGEMPAAESLIPEKYADASKSGLSVTVNEGDNDIPLDLTD